MNIEAPTKPTPEDFNLASEQYLIVKRKTNRILNKSDKAPYLVFIVTAIIAVFVFDNVDKIGIGIFILLISFTILSGIFEYMEERYINLRLICNKGYKQYKAYEDASLSYRVKINEYEKEQARLLAEQEKERIKKEKKIKQRQHFYWISLDPYVFEKEVALLFKKNGYKTHVTKGSGDGGIDILIEKDGKKGIVQCKRFKNKVGPGSIRDLYGTMMAGKYKYAFVVCPSGFSDKAYEFSRGKSIKLIGLKRIMEMVR